MPQDDSFLYLFRHGHVYTNGALLGQRDLPLSPKGILQAVAWKKELSHIAFTKAWSSPLQRSIQTASVLLSGSSSSIKTPLICEDLTEISLGKWEGLDIASIKKHYPCDWEKRGKDVLCYPPPAGESFLQLQNRVLPVFFHICREAKKQSYSLLVAHQAVNRIIMAYLMALPASHLLSIPQPYASCTIISLADFLVRKQR